MHRRHAVLTAGAVLSLAGTARAATMDLVDQSGVRLERPVGVAELEEVAVARAGDVDGDGLGDLLLVAPEAVHVVPGRPSLRSAPRVGFRRGAYRITAPPTGLLSTASPAGDVNGDGLADVIVTAPHEHAFYRRLGPRRRESVDGVAYVVLGSPEHGDVDVERLDGRGFRIAGVETGAASGIGDVNGDGLDDVAVGASYRGGDGVSVVLGSAEPRSVRTDRVGGRGYEIRPRRGDLLLGSSVAPVGDFDADGHVDFAIGDLVSLGRRPDPDAYEQVGPGAAYVVFGAPESGTLQLADPNGRALRIDPPRRGFLTGYALAGPGDVNGDGVADLAVGAPAHPLGGRPGPGSAWVVFGSRSRSSVNLARLGSRGFRIAGVRRESGVGSALGPAGDVDGDGLSDLLVGAPGEFEDGGPRAGAAYLVMGGPTTATVDVRSLERADGRGFALRGLSGDQAGQSVAAPGDMDGDGYPEIAVAAPRSCAGAGTAYPGEPVERTSVVYLLTLGMLAAARSTEEPDELEAAQGGDRLRGRGGGDLLVGSAAADCLYGDGGGDRLVGGRGRDALWAGAGDDSLEATDGARDFLDCGRGRDVAVVDRRDRMTRCERVRTRRARPARSRP